MARKPALSIDKLKDLGAGTLARLVLEEAELPRERWQVHCQRVEDLPGPYDGVVSRAFAPPPDALAHAERLLRPGGTCVLFLQAGAQPPERPGWSLLRSNPYTVGGRQRKGVHLRWDPPT